MVGLKKYKIDIFNLSNGEHEYELDFNPDFFRHFENSLIEKGHGIAKINLKKSETFLDLSFEIGGNIELICDRSLDAYEHPVEIKKNIILKFGEETETPFEDEISFIPWNTQSIYLDQFIYEFLSLEIPMKKLHPRFESEIEEDDGNEDGLFYSSQKDEEKDDGDKIDPRWNKLMDLKTDNDKDKHKKQKH